MTAQHEPAARPITLARRGFLGSTVTAFAAVAVANATEIVAKSSPPAAAYDPVYDLIQAYRDASAAHTSALEEEARLSLVEDPAWWDEQASIACCAHQDAFWALIETNPTTLAGAAALLTFLHELTVDEEWMFDVDGGDLVVPLIANLAQTLPRLVASSNDGPSIWPRGERVER
jgi:hypothetical protein